MKKKSITKGVLFITFLWYALVMPLSAQPHIALVLSGGGARGLAQIGVLRSFEKHHIRPDLIVATSMGSIIGSLWAAGYSADSIAAMTTGIDWEKIFGNNSSRKTLFINQKDNQSNALFELRFDYQLRPVLPNALSSGQAFYDYLAPLLTIPQFNAGLDFDSLPIPLRIVATDLLSGEKVIFSRGNIGTALRASCAVPLAFTPVEIDSMLLADGGIMSNIPVDVARQSSARHIIAVDVTSPPWNRDDLSNPVKLVDQIVAIGSRHERRNSTINADFLITPDLGQIRNTDFSMTDTIMQIGFETTELLIDSLEKTINTPAAAPQRSGLHEYPSKPSGPAVIRSVAIAGNTRTSADLILRASGLHPGDTLTPLLIRKSISSLYATDLFDNVTVDINRADTATITCRERLYYRMQMGLRFDEFHLGEGYIEPAYENCFGNGSILLMHLQYGLRREKYTLELKGSHLLSRNIANTMHLQLYSSKESIQEIDTIIPDSVEQQTTTELHERTLRKTGSYISVETQLGRSISVGMDLRLEKFRVQSVDAGVLNDLFGIGLKKSLPYLSLRFLMDTMDKYPFPKTGTKLLLTVGGATETFGGRYSFVKYTGSYSRYFTFCDNHTLMPKFSFGWSDNPLPEVEQVYLGGAVAEESSPQLNVYNYHSFYGLPARGVAADRYAILHLEYRCEMKKNLFAHIATDWGTAWDADSRESVSLISDAPVGLGVGISYRTYLGPVKLVYGQLIANRSHLVATSGEFFYFSAGHDF